MHLFYCGGINGCRCNDKNLVLGNTKDAGIKKLEGYVLYYRGRNVAEFAGGIQ